MKKVICLYNGLHSINVGNRLTIGKIYDVVRIIGDVKCPVGVEIIDNLGTPGTYVFDWNGQECFKDATDYIRDRKLNDLGIN